ncbi:MAG: flagellin [Acetobacteraceae bacterium]
MSGSLGGVGSANYPQLSELIANATGLRQQLATLTEQSSSGLVAETYAGLGSGASVSLDLNPEISQMTTWQNNINAAQGRMGVTQTAVGQLSSIASNFAAELNTVGTADPSAVTSVAAAAQQALVQVANLLNTTDGTGYVFSGQDSANPAVPGAEQILSSGFYTQISTAVAGLAANGAAATEASVVGIGASNAAGTSPFSAALSQPAATLQAQLPSVQVGAGQFVSIGLVASANSYVPSTGVNTTGSYMRDLMTSLAVIGSLSTSEVSSPDFQTLVGDTQATLQGVVTAMNQDAGVLGNQASALTSTASTLADTQNALTTQVGAVQNVDMAKTATELTGVQTQLQASYQLIANLGSLSLVNYL